ncbi:MAG: hypothetical protein Kow0042_12300 [Calditrichia bacterium]
MDKKPAMTVIFAGIDPSAKPENKSALCLLDAHLTILHLGEWNTFSELDHILRPYKSLIQTIGIDGPLQLPHELKRCCFTPSTPGCSHRQTVPYRGRYCEYVLNKNGYRCYATSKNSFVKSWVLRCLDLAQFLMSKGYALLEVFPTATRKILFSEVSGKKQSKSTRLALVQALKREGVIFPQGKKSYSHHQLDALLAAYTALLHYRGKTMAVGDERDGYIIIPRTQIRR